MKTLALKSAVLGVVLAFASLFTVTPPAQAACDATSCSTIWNRSTGGGPLTMHVWCVSVYGPNWYVEIPRGSSSFQQGCRYVYQVFTPDNYIWGCSTNVSAIFYDPKPAWSSAGWHDWTGTNVLYCVWQWRG